MKLLDLFCGAGGAGMGYHRAGYEVVGVDINPQPHYPFEFHQANALDYLAANGHHFDVIHASPPCQLFSVTAHLAAKGHQDLVDPIRQLLREAGKPYIIENVPGAPLENALTLCGTMFGLAVIRHRAFECQPPIYFPPASCGHDGLATAGRLRRLGITTRTPSLKDGFSYVTVAGNNYLADEGRAAMGIDWMSKRELSQAIPPAYTHFIGSFMRKSLTLKVYA
jgi:DNA (cytosine-5)-methyltransferase 1